MIENKIKDILWQETKRNIFIEFYYRSDRGCLIEHLVRKTNEKDMLFEQYGIDSDIPAMACYIHNEITSNKIDDNKILFRFKQYNELIRRVEVRLVDFELIGFDMENSKINEFGRYNPLIIYLPKDKVLNKTITVKDIVHELTHSIQNKNYNLHHKDTMSDKYNEIMKTNDNLQQDTTYFSDIIKKLQKILYFFNNFERGSFISEMKYELDACKVNFYSIKDVCNFIKNTEVYKLYENTIATSYEFWRIKDKKTQNDILTYVNKNSQYTLNTYNQFLKWLGRTVSDTRNKFKQLLPKMAYEKLSLSKIIS